MDGSVYEVKYLLLGIERLIFHCSLFDLAAKRFTYLGICFSSVIQIGDAYIFL